MARSNVIFVGSATVIWFASATGGRLAKARRAAPVPTGRRGGGLALGGRGSGVLVRRDIEKRLSRNAPGATPIAGYLLALSVFPVGVWSSTVSSSMSSVNSLSETLAEIFSRGLYTSL